jgi:O-antigen/teichoic acid export membrane protein
MSKVALLSISLRAASLACRLALTLYLAKFFGLPEVAAYGLLMSAVAGMNALSGLGLNAQIDRLLVTLPGSQALLLLRDRILIRFIIGALLVLTWLVAAQEGWLPELKFPILSGIIVVGEALADDMQRGFLMRRRTLSSNLFHFIRAGSWIPPTIFLGLVFEELRTVESVMIGWIISLLVSAAVAYSFAKRGSGTSLFKGARIDRLFSLMRGATLFYFAELAWIAALFVDRLIVAGLLGMVDAGVYMFLWSLTNAVTSLIQAGYVNQAFPRLVSAWKLEGVSRWRSETMTAIASVLASSLALGGAMLALMFLILPPLGFPLATGHASLALMMVAAVVIRLVADVVHGAIYSAGRDKTWIAINFGFLIWTAPLFAILILLFGLDGAGLASVLSGLILLLSRLAVFQKTQRR